MVNNQEFDLIALMSLMLSYSNLTSNKQAEQNEKMIMDNQLRTIEILERIERKLDNAQNNSNN